jgi:hypothetical protein
MSFLGRRWPLFNKRLSCGALSRGMINNKSKIIGADFLSLELFFFAILGLELRTSSFTT